MLMRRLERKVVIVTGGAGGIGAACARRYAAEGANVVVADIDPAGAVAVACEIDGLGLVCDHTSRGQCEAVVASTLERFGKLDVLHNNAGIGWTGPFDGVGEAEIARLLSVLLVGPMIMTQAALAALSAAAGKNPEGAAILFTSSGLGLHGRPNVSIYAAAKHGIIGLTRSLALEYAVRSVRVNAVCPGFVDTAMTRATTGGWGDNAAVQQMFRKSTPTGRNSTPEDIAAAAAFLVSRDARNVTGLALLVDGGGHEA
jgi:NAD(P)-dependent dehydrogenase (short-subunit alcohol dehydrogenase family)